MRLVLEEEEEEKENKSNQSLDLLTFNLVFLKI